MSIALRKRLEREYGQGPNGSARLGRLGSAPQVKGKKRGSKRPNVDTVNTNHAKRQRPSSVQATEQKRLGRRIGMGMIRSILNAQASAASKPTSTTNLTRKHGDVKQIAGETPLSESAPGSEGSSGLPKEKQKRSNSPPERRKVSKICQSFAPLLDGVNARSLVMRKRLEAEYGFRPAHQRKMGYFSYVAEKEGAEQAMAIMEDTLEEDSQEVTKAKAEARSIVKEFSRAKPDSNFLSRLLKSTIKHNKRVLEELEALERSGGNDGEDEGESTRIAGIAELVRLYLAQGAGNQAGKSSLEEKDSENPIPVPRMASALFGVKQGTVLQKRLARQYGLGDTSNAEKKAEAIKLKQEERAKRPGLRGVKPGTRGGRSLFAALSGGVFSKKQTKSIKAKKKM